jgi:hypothetical protein
MVYKKVSPMSTPLIGDASCSSASPMYNNIVDTVELKRVTYVDYIIGDTPCPSASPILLHIGDMDLLNASLMSISWTRTFYKI